MIAAIASRGNRREMQDAGRQIERETGGRWLANAVAALPHTDQLIIDSVRRARKVKG